MRVARIIFRALGLILLAFAFVRYSCNVYTSVDLPICKYTAASYYRAALESRFPLVVHYSDRAFAKYENVVAPAAGDAVIRVKSAVRTKFVPGIVKGSKRSGRFVATEVYPRAIRYTIVVQQAVARGYATVLRSYEVSLKPFVVEFYYKTMMKHPFIENAVFKSLAKYQILKMHVLKYFNILSHNMRTINDNYGYGKLAQNQLYIKITTEICRKLRSWSGAVQEKLHTVWVHDFVPSLDHLKQFLITDDSETNIGNRETTDSYEYDDDDDEEEITETSTIVVTLTQTLDSGYDLKPTSKSANGLNEADSHLSVEELVREQFSSWRLTIESKLNSTLEDFENDVNQFAQEKLDKIQPLMGDLLKHASNTSQTNFQIITRAVMDVNCTKAVDSSTNETIWFDSKGTQLPRYMTRELMRELFSTAHAEFDTLSQEIRSHLKQLAEEVNDQVEVLRRENVELFEEWADVLITEWSKNLAYVDVVVNDENKKTMEKEQRDNWKQFLKLKRKVINTRDLLMEHPVELSKLQNFVNQVQNSLRTLSHENGEYLYILRSKANLEFQAREALEREQKQKLDGPKSAVSQKNATKSVTIVPNAMEKVVSLKDISISQNSTDTQTKKRLQTAVANASAEEPNSA